MINFNKTFLFWSKLLSEEPLVLFAFILLLVIGITLGLHFYSWILIVLSLAGLALIVYGILFQMRLEQNSIKYQYILRVFGKEQKTIVMPYKVLVNSTFEYNDIVFNVKRELFKFESDTETNFLCDAIEKTEKYELKPNFTLV